MLIAVTLARGLGGSLQAIADTVELHIAVDLVAAVVAGLGAVILLRFARAHRSKSEFEDWVVQPPAPTRPLVADLEKVTAVRSGAGRGRSVGREPT